MSSISISLNGLAGSVKEHLKHFPEIRKSLPVFHNQTTFATDLALVAFSLRTGYLVDLFSPQEPVDLFSRLLVSLRNDPLVSHFFTHVFHLYEPLSEQSFFINATLLAQRVGYATGNSFSVRDPHVTFVHLQLPGKIISEPPSQVVKAMETLLPLLKGEPLPASSSLPDGIPLEAAVPLAAILLDYPVAYVPSVSHNNFLGGVPLNFYECHLSGKSKRDNKDTHTIMKFSCPTDLMTVDMEGGNAALLQPEKMKRILQDIFTERSQRLEESALDIVIEHSTHTLQHVAF